MRSKLKGKHCHRSWEHHELRITAQLRLFSRLLGVPVHRMLQEFIDHVSMDICARGDEQRSRASLYLQSTGYGRQYYSVEQLGALLEELNAQRQEWAGYTQARYDGIALDRYLIRRRLWSWYGRWRNQSKKSQEVVAPGKYCCK